MEHCFLLRQLFIVRDKLIATHSGSLQAGGVGLWGFAGAISLLLAGIAYVNI